MTGKPNIAVLQGRSGIVDIALLMKHFTGEDIGNTNQGLKLQNQRRLVNVNNLRGQILDLRLKQNLAFLSQGLGQKERLERIGETAQAISSMMC